MATNPKHRDSLSGLHARLRAAWRERGISPAGAREAGRELLDVARRCGDRRAVADALRLTAWGEIARGGFDEAGALLEEAVALSAAEADRAGEALATTLRGTVLDRIGDMVHARDLHERALEMARDAGEREIEAAALNGLGRIHGETGEYAGALELYRRALAIAEDAGASEEQGRALLGIGNAHESMAEYRDALAAYERALEVAERAGHVQLQAYATGNIGLIHERIGDIGTALSFELRALDLKEDLGDRWGTGVSLNNIGLIYTGLGNYARALEYLRRALECAEEIGDRSGEMVALHNIGHLYETLGERSQVLDYHQRVLEIAGAIGDRKGEAMALGDLGRFHARLGDHHQALLYALRALRMHQEIDDRFGQQSALETIAGIHQDGNDFEKAIRYAEQALDMAERIEDRRGIVESLTRLGSAASAAGRYALAVDVLDRALRLAREGGYLHDVMTAAQKLSEAHRLAGDEPGSRKYHRLGQDLAVRIFGGEESRRTRRLIDDLNRRRLRDKAASLGLPLEELDAHIDPDGPGRSGARIDRAGEPAAERSHAITVSTFGELRVTVDGRPLRTADWGRRKARDLFKFLLIHHRRTVTLEEIIERLWDGAADRNTELLVMNAVSRIRRALEPERSPRDRNSLLTGVDRTYRLDLGDDAEIDFIRFKELTVLARGAVTAVERCEYYATAIELYSDDFLKEDYYEEWTAAERDLLKDAFLEALEYLAGEQLRQRRFEEAQEVARRILAFDATSDRGHEILLEALVARGRRTELARSWEECRAAYADELGVEPPASLRRIVEASAAPVAT
jgi:tetratricopeptide (TPR) repeat protein/two-component SAPR family response regulator